MGAQMMASSGPSYEPTNLFSIAGQGLAAGIKGYDSSIESSQKQLLTNAKKASDQAKLDAEAKQQQADKSFSDSIGGDSGGGASAGGMGYSEDQLMQIYKHLMANGDYTEANKVLGHIMKLRDGAAGKGMIVGEDGNLVVAPGYSEGLGENSRAEDAGKYTSDRKNYEFYVEQATAKGETPLDFNTWQKEQKAAGSSKVNVNTGANSDKFKEKSDEEAAKDFAGIIQDARNAPQLAGDMDMLLDLSKEMDTGKWAEFKLRFGPWAELAGFTVEGLSQAQAFDATINRLVPGMRPAGSGAMSDFDAKMFLRSLPNLANTPEGNEIIAVTMRAVQEHKMAAAAIARRAQKGEIHYTDAYAEMDALPNPYERFKAYKAAKEEEGINITTGLKKAVAEQKAYDERKANEDAESVDTNLPKVTSIEERDALPSGTVYIAPDGTRKVKK